MNWNHWAYLFLAKSKTKMFPWWSPAAKASPIVLKAVRRNLIFLPCNENALDVEWLMQTINLRRSKWINWNNNRCLDVRQPLPDGVFEYSVSSNQNVFNQLRLLLVNLCYQYHLRLLCIESIVNRPSTGRPYIQANCSAFQASSRLFSG